MYQVTIIGVGKLKEKYLREGIKEYSKRLQPYAKLKIVEVTDESVSETAREKETEQAMEHEAQRIISAIPADSFVIACDINGRDLSSEQFAKQFSDNALYGRSKFCLIIGGSCGLHNSVKKRSNLLLSFGKMTLPHQLMRVVLLEQIYRAMRIIHNEPYHK